MDPRRPLARSGTNGQDEVRSLRKLDKRFFTVLRMVISVRSSRIIFENCPKFRFVNLIFIGKSCLYANSGTLGA